MKNIYKEKVYSNVTFGISTEGELGTKGYGVRWQKTYLTAGHMI